MAMVGCNCGSCQRERRWEEEAKQKTAAASALIQKNVVPATCPTCGKPSKTKTNGTTGKQFTGCSGWPHCTWTMNGVRSMASKAKIGKKIKFQTNNGFLVGTVVGENDNSNFILRVDKRSPVKGFKLSDDMTHTVQDFVEDKYIRGLKSYTYWHLAQTDEVEEATDADLLPEAEEEALPGKRTVKEVGTVEEQTVQSDEEEETEKETTMADKKSAIQIAKDDGNNAMFRVAGKRLSTGANAAVTKAFKGMLGPEHGEAVEAIMKTPLGLAVTQLSLGWGLTYAPGVGQDPRIQKLAEEFRVQGTAEGLDMIVGSVMTHLTPILEDALKMLPGSEQPANARIAASNDAAAPAPAVEEEVLELSDVPPEGKRAAAGK